MSNPINDGGPAFPCTTDGLHRAYASKQADVDGNYATVVHQTGLTLRDYFAAKALPELVRTALDLDHAVWDATAQHAYLIADAMIKERAK